MQVLQDMIGDLSNAPEADSDQTVLATMSSLLHNMGPQSRRCSITK